MNLYQKISLVLALVLYLPLAWQIWTEKVKQNLATFILWGSLDVIAAISIFIQGGNYQLPAAYVLGCILVIICILKTRNFTWTSFETFMSVLVFICLVGWKVSGPYLATILSTTGVVLGGFPQLRDTWNDPESCPKLIYVGYSVANLLSTLGGKYWSVEERLYSTACFVLCVIIVVASLRKPKITSPIRPFFDEDIYYG